MEIIDVIYGKFTIPSDVAAIVETPQFQRLKHIKQLGFLKINNSIEYQHHRYAHCLGTYHAANLMLDALEKNTEWLKNNNNKIPLVYRKAVRIAALLHDIAHGPFSHSWERIAHNYTHEKEAFACVEQIFDQLNEQLFPELRCNHNFGIELIKSLIEGDIENFKFKDSLPHQYKFVFEIVSNKRCKMDVDKWDYLKRDAIYLKHLSQPSVDFDDVFLQSRVSENGSHIEYRYEDYEKIYRLFAARYDFHINCYSLPNNILLDYILNLAVQECEPKINNIVVNNIKASMLSEFLQLTDNHIFELIENSVLYKFLQYETKFQEVEHLEKETCRAYIRVDSVRQYMPKEKHINFYGDIKNQSILNDQTSQVNKIYACYCDQSSQTVYYMIRHQ